MEPSREKMYEIQRLSILRNGLMIFVEKSATVTYVLKQLKVFKPPL